MRRIAALAGLALLMAACGGADTAATPEVLPAGTFARIQRDILTPQLTVDSFAVSPTMERELFLYRRLNNASDLYVNTDWEHPAFTNFTTPLVLEVGDALVSVVTYNNVRDLPVGFGLLSTDEMNVIFGYAY